MTKVEAWVEGLQYIEIDYLKNLLEDYIEINNKTSISNYNTKKFKINRLKSYLVRAEIARRNNIKKLEKLIEKRDKNARI